ncbi:MAG: PAS domain S-box protein [Candidatus Thiodiazotropha lotti]|nr:PAS domain S-box protein [Candidatus Thiodiazotropha lotti]MCG8007912.1 PAS domain S-box protein [Candidatus Thiodiazotropha lotti]MCW4195499.1 PAS domain S-box protein [Candidatus Thiodiazotropha lotti]MCW4198373.1 PAS domain S-box protein [Candidatus Thiodiazotropha lotti]
MSYKLFVNCLVCCAFFFLGGASKADTSLNDKRVLLIYSYHPGFPTTPKILAGLRSIFTFNGPKIDIEFMDSKRLHDEQSQINFLRQLSYKLNYRPAYDLVIVANDHALEMVSGYGKSLFKDTPVVFLGINSFELALELERMDGYTGVVENPSFKENLVLAKTLFPAANKAYVIVDGTTSGQHDLRHFEKELETFSELEIEKISLADLKWAELEKSLSAINEKDLVFLLSAYRDSEKISKSFEESLKLIVDATGVPIFHFRQHGLKSGIFGGIMIDHSEQAKQAARLAKQILEGVSVESLKVIRTSPNVPYFDYRVVLSYGLDESEFPRETHWVNLPEDESHYKNYFYYAISGLLLLFIAVFAFLIFFGRYRKLSSEISKSEENYRKIVENSHDGIFQVDLNGEIQFANVRLAEMLGYKLSEIIGLPLHGFIQEESREEAVGSLLKGVGEESDSYEVKFINRKGEEVWTSLNTSRIRDDQGRVCGILSLVRDIDVLRKERSRLRESEEKFKQLTHSIKEVFWLGSPDWQQVFYISPGYEQIWGRSRESLYDNALNWMEALPEDDLKCVEEFLGEERSQDWVELTFPEYRVYRPDGTMSWVEAKAFAIKNERGECYRIAGIAEDITERKENELELSYRLEYERMVAEHSSRLVGAGVAEMQDSFDNLLAQLGQLTGSSRAYLVLVANEHSDVEVTNEWYAENRHSLQSLYDQNSKKLFTCLFEFIQVGGVDFIGSIDELSDQEVDCNQELKKLDIATLKGVPIRINGRLTGFLGLDQPVVEYAWLKDDMSMLRTVADLMTGAIRRQKIVADLRSSRRILSTLLNNLPGAVYRCNNDEYWSMQFISEGIEVITGYASNDIIGNHMVSYSELIHKDDKETVRKVVIDAVNDHDHFEIEYRILDKANRVHWVWERGALIEDEDGVGLIEGFITEISDKKQIESALKSSEEYLKLIMNSTAESIYVLDENGVCISVNKACLEQLGYTDENELKGRVMHDVMHHTRHTGEFYGREECPMYLSTTTGKQVHVEDEVFWRKDGTSFPVEYWSYPLIENSERRGVVVSFIDISERKFTEELMSARVNLHDFAQNNTTKEFLKFAIGEACKKTDSELGFFYFIDPDRNSVAIQVWASGQDGEAGVVGREQQMDRRDDEVWAVACRLMKPIIQNEVNSIDTIKRTAHGSVELRSELCVPVVSNSRVVAVMGVGNRKLGEYGEVELQKVEQIAELTWDLAESKIIKEKIEESKVQLNTILDTVSEAVALWDYQGRLRYANPEFLNLIITHKDEPKISDYIGKTLSAFDSAYPFITDINEYLHGLLMDGKSVDKCQIEHEAADGDSSWISLSVHALYDSNRSTITGAVSVITNITDEKNSEAKLEQLAHYDNLTKLPNRMLSIDRLQQMIARADRTSELMAVCYLDLDGFKQVNDTYGHEAGDELLKQTANRLGICIRHGDTVSRLGGDEFLILLAGLNDQHETQNILGRILEQVAKAYIIGEVSVTNVSASIGVTLFPVDKSDADGLIRHADQAMYLAKRMGKNRYQFYSKELERRIFAQQEVLGDVVRALNEDQLEIYYQPVVDCVTGSVTSCEVLLRWNNPILGLMKPAEFLPLLNRYEIKLSITDWVLKQVVNYVSKQKANGSSFPVSFNLFPEQCFDSGILEALKRNTQQLEAAKRHRINIEIQESDVVASYTKANQFIKACNRMGIECILGGIGTGELSVIQLAQLSVEQIKINLNQLKTIATKDAQVALVKSILALAESSGKTVIVQGIENSKQLSDISKLGCTKIQGYLISHPLPEETFTKWIGDSKITSAFVGAPPGMNG